MKDLSLAAAILALVATAGCVKFGSVNQGLVVEYLANEGIITLIPHSGPDAPVTVQIPPNPREMGPAPAPGRLVRIDTREQQLTVFDPDSRSLRKIPFTQVTQADKVRRDDPRILRKQFPIIDHERRTVIIHVSREQRLLTVELAAEFLRLPADTWRFGDEIRYYYKDPRQALRLMNVTRTDLSKAGE